MSDTEPRFIQIAVAGMRTVALDEDGGVWEYQSHIPYAQQGGWRKIRSDRI